MLSCRGQGQLYFYVIVYVVVQEYHDPEDGSITLLRHVGNYLPVDTRDNPEDLNLLPAPLYVILNASHY